MPGPGFKIADGFIEIHAEVDENEIERDIRAGVGAISRAARTFDIFADLDPSKIRASITEALRVIPERLRTIQIETDLDPSEIGGSIIAALRSIPGHLRTIELLVDIDVTDLARKIEEAIALIPPNMRTITVNVDLDMGAAVARLGALQGLLGGSGAIGSASPFAGLSTSLSSLLPIILGVAAAVGVLYTAFAVLPAVIGLTIAAIGGVTTAMFGFIGIAAAGLLGMRGMTEALKQVATTGTVTAEALKNLTPSARAFVLALGPAHAMMERFTKTAQEAIFKGLAPLVAWVIRSLGVLDPFIGEIAAGLGNIGKAVLVTVGLPRHIEMIASIWSHVASALNTVALIIPLVVDAFLRIGESAIPVLDKVTGKVYDLATQFSTWIADLDDSGALDQIFTTAMREAKNLLDIFGGLIIVTGKFLGVLFPGFEAGQSSLKGVVVKLDEISAWLDDPAHVAGLRAWISGFMDITKAVYDAVGNIIGGFGRVAQFFADNRPALVGAMAVLAAGALAYAINMGIAAAATIAATWPVLAIAAGIAALVAALVLAWSNWDTFRDAVQGAIGWLQQNVPPVFEIIKKAVTDFYNTALAPMVSYISDNREAFGNLGKVLLVVAGIIVGVVVVASLAMASAMVVVVGMIVAVGITITAFTGVLYNFAQTLWDAFGNAREFLGGAVEAIENFVGRIPGFLGSIVEAVEGFFASLWATIQAVPERIGGLIDPIEERVATFIASLIRWFTELPGKIAAALAAAPGVIYAALVGVFDTVTYLMGFVAGTVVQFFIDLPGRIMATAEALWGAVTMIFTVVQTTTVAIVTATVDAVYAFFVALPGRVGGALVAIWGVITTAFTTVWTIAVGLVTATVDAVTGFFAQLPGRAGAAVSGLWGAIAGAFFGAKDQATGQANQTATSVADTLRSVPGRAAEALSGFAGAVSGRLREAVGAAYDIGSDIMRGIANGISAGVGFVLDVVNRAASNIKRGFQDALGIGSPSKVMAREVGRWIPPGIAEGIRHAQRDLDLSIGSAAVNLVSGAGRAVMSTSTTAVDRSTSSSIVFNSGAIVVRADDGTDALDRVIVAARQLAGARR